MAARHNEVLGIAPDASPEEIKRAFRKIARQCHPDVAGDDPEALARFKAAREAYEALTNPKPDDEPAPTARRPRRKKSDGSFFRAAYRRASGGRAEAPGEAPADPGLDDLFQDFGFGGGGRAGSRSSYSHSARFQGQGHPPRRGRDVTLDLQIPASVARDGGPWTFHYARLGKDPSWSPGRPGDGVRPLRDAGTIDVPPGTRQASLKRYPGMGDAGAWGGPPGDLLVRFRVQEEAAGSPTSKRRGATVPPGGAAHTKASAGEAPDRRVVNISVVEALLGGRVTVSAEGGDVVMTIPPCTSSATVFRLGGRGSMGMSGARRDLLVELRIVVPDQLDAASRELVRQFAALHPDVPDR